VWCFQGLPLRKNGLREEVETVVLEDEQTLLGAIVDHEGESTGPIPYSNPAHSSGVEECHQDEGASTSGRLVSRTHTAVGHSKGVNCVHATEKQLLSGGRGESTLIILAVIALVD
jgi:hypothetical protein